MYNLEDNFCFVPGVSPEKLIVVFAAANAKGFTLYRDLERFGDYDKLFIKDPYEVAWYQNGIGAGCDSAEELTQFILSKRRSTSTKVFATGISMGGYASILCAALGNFHAVLAIVPQVRISAGSFRNPKKGTNIYFPELDVLISQRNIDTKFNVLVGLHDYTDMFHLSYLLDKDNVNPIVFVNADHSLPKHIHGTTGLGEVVIQFVEGEDFSFDLPFVRDCSPYKWVDGLRLAMNQYLAGNFEHSLDTIRTALEEYPQWVGGYVFAARLCKELGFTENAEEYWLKSLLLAPHLTESLHQLHFYYARAGKDALAGYFLELYSKIRRAKKGGLQALAEMDGML